MGAVPLQVPTRENPYTAFLAHWWWMLLIGIVVGTGAALELQQHGPVPYQSTAYVQVNYTGNINARNIRTGVTTLSAQAAAPSVLVGVSQALHGKLNLSPAQLALMINGGNIVIKPIFNTPYVTITASSTKASDARLLADTFAQVITAQSNQTGATNASASRDEVKAQIDQLQKQLAPLLLQQKEKDLTRSLQDQRTQLLQIRTAYLQNVDSTIQQEQQLMGANGGAAHKEARAGGGSFAAGSAGSNGDGSSSRTDNAAQAAAEEAQLHDEVAAKVQSLQKQLDALNAQIAGSPAASQAAADQARLNDLLAQQQTAKAAPTLDVVNLRIALLTPRVAAAKLIKQQQDLQTQVRDLQPKVAGLSVPLPTNSNPQTVYQHQLDLQQAQSQLAAAQTQLASVTGQIKASGFTDIEPSTIDVTLPDMENQLRGLLDQRTQLEQGSSAGDLDAQIKALQARLTSEQDAAQLVDQRQHLESQLSQAQQQLFEIQQNQIAHLTAPGPTQPAATQPGVVQVDQLTPEQRQLYLQALDNRTKWTQDAQQQEQDYQKNVDELAKELNQVQNQLSTMPNQSDQALADIMLAAYTDQMKDLLKEYQGLQANASGIAPAVSKLGNASEPLPTLTTKKALAGGAAGGLALAAVIAYLLEMRRRDRLAPLAVVARGNRSTISTARVGHGNGTNGTNGHDSEVMGTRRRLPYRRRRRDEEPENV